MNVLFARVELLFCMVDQDSIHTRRGLVIVADI